MSETEPQNSSGMPQDPETVTGSSTSAMLGAVLTHAIGLAMHNAVTTQQNAQIANAAAVSATCARILSVNRSKRPKKTATQSSVPRPGTKTRK